MSFSESISLKPCEWQSFLNVKIMNTTSEGAKDVRHLESVPKKTLTTLRRIVQRKSNDQIAKRTTQTFQELAINKKKQDKSWKLYRNKEKIHSEIELIIYKLKWYSPTSKYKCRADGVKSEVGLTTDRRLFRAISLLLFLLLLPLLLLLPPNFRDTAS